MNQSVIAGLGNVYTDEVLFHALVDPRRAATDISDDAAARIHRAMLHVAKTAIERDADPDRVPESWLLPRREDGAACPRCDATIRKAKVSGRSTYWCPSCQG